MDGIRNLKMKNGVTSELNFFIKLQYIARDYRKGDLKNPKGSQTYTASNHLPPLPENFYFCFLPTASTTYCSRLLCQRHLNFIFKIGELIYAGEIGEIMLLKNSKDQFELYHCAKYLKRYKN